MPKLETIPALPPEKRRKRSSKKLLFVLFLFFCALLGILFFQSSLSKIDEITIAGNKWLPTDKIQASLGVKQGDHFFSVSASVLKERVLALGIVETVKVAKRFPGRISIDIHEFDEVAFEVSQSGETSAILSNGTAIPLPASAVIDKPILAGWDKDAAAAEQKKQLCETLKDIDPQKLSDVSEIRPDPTVSYPDRIKLYTRSRIEVITTIGYLPNKADLLQDYLYDLKQQNITNRQLILLENEYSPPKDKPADKTADKPADNSSGKTGAQ